MATADFIRLSRRLAHLAGQRLDRARRLYDEARELGPRRLAFRIRWEAETRSGATRWLDVRPRPLKVATSDGEVLLGRLPFTLGAEVRAFMGQRLDTGAATHMHHLAEQAARGRLLCFGRWFADFGDPIDWHINPQNGLRWNPHRHWSNVMADEARVGDIKLSWEIARFPQAYQMARAAVLIPSAAPAMAEALARQIRSFVDGNPYGQGIHWVSGQEIAIRNFAWLFAISVLRNEPGIIGILPAVVRALYESGCRIRRHINYARKAVYNNHLIAEGFGLLTLGWLLPNLPEADASRRLGEAVVDECAVGQFKTDGGYIQNSHNYHRAALQFYLWGVALLRQQGRTLPDPWRLAMERSLDFLLAHQSPTDGRLPNYGANDGALPLLLSTCDYSDFRPTLQAISVVTRGERLYPPGPWDEEAAWLATPARVAAAPLRPRAQGSRSLSQSGYHVLRGNDPATFASFRCGNLTERFSQIDMLSVDVWWCGQNVIADAGSYLYNGPAEWHDHFFRTGGHNTVQVDGLDQMLHHRRFKVLYWTKARLLSFVDNPRWCLAEGEHDGFQRTLPQAIHRRAVLLCKCSGCVVVVDTMMGTGEHEVTLQWLAGNEGFDFDPSRGLIRLETPAGSFFVKVVDSGANPASATVVCGQTAPPRGWLSRYYGEKIPVPSLHAGGRMKLPATLVTILSPSEPGISKNGNTWLVRTGDQQLSFALRDGRFDSIKEGSPL